MSSSSQIVTGAVSGLFIALVACSSPKAETPGSAVDPSSADAGAGSSEATVNSAPANDAGDTTAPPPPAVVGPGNDHCADATSIPLDAANPRVVLQATTVNATHDIDAPCSTDKGADVFYKFSVSKRVIVYADAFGADWKTVLFLLSDKCEPMNQPTTAGDAVCNAGACGTEQSRIVALLEPGAYRLGLSGRGGATGAATVHFEWALAGSGTIAPLPAGTNVLTGKTVGMSGNIDGLSPDCLAAASENSYWWARCPADPGGAFSASTCGGTSWESIVELQLPQAVRYTCNIDGCGLQANLGMTIPAGAGLGVLSVDGQGGSDVGTYTLNVTRP